MNIIDKNTLNSIKQDMMKGKRTIKAIAAECSIFEDQADNDEAKAAYARLSDCKTRKAMYAVFCSII